MAPKLGWIGLGNMGRGMCKNLVEKGELTDPLILFNRTTSRAETLADQLGRSKTTVASTIQELVSASDIIFTCVGDDNSIRETIQTALEVDVSGKVFVDCSTVHPETTNALAADISSKNAEFAACPVFGAPAMADSGQLLCVLAGPAAVVEKVKPYTAGVIGRAIIDFSGEEHGKATLLKIIGNTFVINMVEALGQGLTLAEKSSLGADNLHKFIEVMFPGPYTAYSTRMREGDYYKREEPLFAVDLAIKDANHALALAESSGAKLPSIEVGKRHLQDVKDHMGARGDISSVYGASRQDGGLKFEN